MTATRAYVALGSNLGDRLANLGLATDRLAAHPDVCLVAASRVVETPAIGPPQGPYLNAVVAIETSLSPEALLSLCQSIEEAGRRQRVVHWGPRTIDLDIVDYGGIVRETESLRLPHPEIARRAFVLVPLAEIAPEWRHPVTGESVAALARNLADSESIRVVAPAESVWRGNRHHPRARTEL